MPPRNRRKNANGAGSVYKRADGRWVAAITLPGRKRQAWYCRTRAEAAQKLRQAQSLQDGGIPTQQSRELLRDYLARWLSDVSPGLAVQTRSRYASVIRVHFQTGIGLLPLAQLGPAHIQTLYGALGEVGRSAGTVRVVHAVLHRALERAARWGLITRNPAALVDLPAISPHAGVALTLPEAQRFLAAAREHVWWPYWVTSLMTGLRPGELLGLRWDDVNLERAELQVRGTLIQDGGRRIQATTKTGRSRTVPLLPQTVAALRAHRVAQAEMRLRAGSAWQDQGIVFAAADGTPLYHEGIRRQFRPLLAGAGLPPMRLHDLRHSAASLLVALGVDIVTVARILGHANTSQTLQTYAHAAPESTRRAVETLGEALDG